MRAKRFAALPAALLVLSVLWQAPVLFRGPNIYDEGLTLTGAHRILLGEVPYRDFWNTHTPGQITVVAALFRLFGSEIMVARVYDVVARAGIAVAVFALAGRMSTMSGALIAWAAVTVYLGGLQYFGYATVPALLCALVGLFPLLAAKDCPGGAGATRCRRLALAGAAAGCSILFRHDLGFEAAAAGLVVLWADIAAGRDRPGAATAGVRQRLGETLWYLGGIAAVTVPVAALFFSLGTPLHRLKTIFFDYPFLTYPQFRGLPLPAAFLERATIALPAAAVVAGLLRGARGVRHGPERPDRSHGLLALGLLGFLAFPQAYTRANVPQQIPVVLTALALLPGLVAPAAAAGRRLRTVPVVFALATLALALRLPLVDQFAAVRNLLARGTIATTHGLERARLVPLEPTQAEAVKTARTLCAGDGALYVGLGRHDKTYVNDALFYFLAGCRCATYYHNLLPGLATTAPVQQEILADLRRLGADPVVLYTGGDAEQEPNRGGVSSGVEILDRGIREDYARTRVLGHFEIWERRKEGPLPGENGYNPAP